MTVELHNLSLFFSAIAKFLLVTGVGIGGAIALIAECCGFRIVALGIEQVPGGQLAGTENRSDASVFDRATSPPRKEWRVA